MKKLILISSIALFGLSACASIPYLNEKGDDNSKSEPAANEESAASCNPGDEGYPKCSTGGGVSGPITGGNE
jgi:starvation-inducible outer membrane lipoprotein